MGLVPVLNLKVWREAETGEEVVLRRWRWIRRDVLGGWSPGWG